MTDWASLRDTLTSAAEHVAFCWRRDAHLQRFRGTDGSARRDSLCRKQRPPLGLRRVTGDRACRLYLAEAGLHTGHAGDVLAACELFRECIEIHSPEGNASERSVASEALSGLLARLGRRDAITAVARDTRLPHRIVYAAAHRPA